MPGAQWLTLDAQEMMQQLGYLGLLLLVYEGKWLSSFVRFFSALVVISIPITMVCFMLLLSQGLATMVKLIPVLSAIIFPYPSIPFDQSDLSPI